MYAVDALRVDRIADAGPFERPHAERYAAAQVILRNAQEEFRAQGIPMVRIIARIGDNPEAERRDEDMHRRAQEIMDRAQADARAQGFELTARNINVGISVRVRIPTLECVIS